MTNNTSAKVLVGIVLAGVFAAAVTAIVVGNKYDTHNKHQRDPDFKPLPQSAPAPRQE